MGKMKIIYQEMIEDKIASGEITREDYMNHTFSDDEIQEYLEKAGKTIQEEIRCLYGFKGVSYKVDCMHCEKQSICEFKKTLINK